jgi:uncharacterized membrane protein
MALMIAGLVLFLGLHSLLVVMPLRRAIVGAVGETAYRIVYSVGALAGLVMIARGYSAWRLAGAPQLYDPPVWLSHISLLLMWFAFVSLAAMYGRSHIKWRLRHPMITAVKIWAFAHLLANGDAASAVLFGAFLAWGVVDRISVKRRERAGLIAPRAFEPRARDDVIAVVVGSILYALFVWKFHLWLIGVSPVAM